MKLYNHSPLMTATPQRQPEENDFRIPGIKSGDKILFIQNANGEIVINNASAQAIYKAQKAFEGVASQIGVYDDEDVLARKVPRAFAVSLC